MKEIIGEFYNDPEMVEHNCCYQGMIVYKTTPGNGMYGGDVMRITECFKEDVDFILRALNAQLKADKRVT